MKSFKKKQKFLPKAVSSSKDFAELNQLEKRRRNKALESGNHIERRWFNDPRTHK